MGESFIIAIDLGTTYSGYAYNIAPVKEDIRPTVKRWGAEQGQDTPKAPNCILFDQDQKFMKFGYEAKYTFTNMSAAEANRCYFFENFKMSLYGKELVSESLTLKGVNGKEMNALQVFSATLCFLKNDALKTINSSSTTEFEASHFIWVLTVPAIWDNAAKQFMREAATQAGIVSRDSWHKLVIALEPEAASIWCKKLPANGFLSENHNRTTLEQTPGTQYIVVDCGGGTIDITVHEVMENRKLKELHKASGNDMGGQTVDKKFKEFLREIFCDGVWDEYEKKHSNELLELMYDFTVAKQVDQDAQVPCPYNLGQIAEKKKNIELFFGNDKGAFWNGGKIKITREKMRSFFEESLRGITASLQKVLDTLKKVLEKRFNIKYILLVGGYALSKILRDYIENQFGSHYKVLCPHLPQEVVVKGAVMFGKDRSIIASRRSAYTYGYCVCEKFDASKHKEEKKFANSDGVWCEDLFYKMVEIDKDVGWDETKNYILCPTSKDQKSMLIRFYSTQRTNLTYVDDWGSEQIGQFVVDMPDTTGGMDRQVRLDVLFGNTEITATATDLLSNTKANVILEFLSQTSGGRNYASVNDKE